MPTSTSHLTGNAGGPFLKIAAAAIKCPEAFESLAKVIGMKSATAEAEKISTFFELPAIQKIRPLHHLNFLDNIFFKLSDRSVKDIPKKKIHKIKHCRAIPRCWRNCV
jgi:hypothetical protein